MAIDTITGEVAFLLGRLVFGTVLGFMGFSHFTNLDGMSGYAKAKGIPAPRLAVAGSGLLLLLGGGGLLESGAYDGMVKLAYVRQAANSNAQAIVAHIDVNGVEFRDTFWITNRNGENFFADKQDPSKKRPLPGYTMADDLCLLTTGLPLTEQPVEEKVVKLYDFEAKKDVPQNVPVLTDLLDKPITVGVIRQTVDKQAKDSAGKYVATGETRDENVADKLFHTESRRTVTEVREGIEEAIFYPKWVEKNAGKTRNRAKGAEGKAGAPGRPAVAAGGAAAGKRKPKSLFG
jgi:hypothetical protein